MELFYSFSPNPRLVRIFMLEKASKWMLKNLTCWAEKIAPSLISKRTQGRYAGFGARRRHAQFVGLV
jgi:hypothetical protein